VKRKTGQYVTISTVGGEECRAFIPAPLPPQPPLRLDPDIQDRLDNALISLGRLDSISRLLPDASLFLYMYVRKEAVLSSQIEGTQSSLSDLLRYENKAALGVPVEDTREVSNHVAATDYGLKRLRVGFPLSLRLLKDIHKVLLSAGRGAKKDPGTFRRSQNWIGGTRPGNAIYVPPPPDKVMECMGALEIYLHDRIPILVKTALAHVQFESIHPFLDGNGRLGRLLITLLLCAEGVLSEPTLYLSLYFKMHRSRYYDLLQAVRVEGAWEDWLRFFLDGVVETSQQAVTTAKSLVGLFEEDRNKIQTLGRPAGSALRVHHELQQKPVLSIARAAEGAQVSIPTAASSLEHLEKLGIAEELPKSGRSRVYSYTRYIQILNEGTEPL
jgi:Fic family protein